MSSSSTVMKAGLGEEQCAEHTQNCAVLFLMCYLKRFVSMQAEYGAASSKWSLHGLYRQSDKPFETGFLVHIVPICRLMEWCAYSFCLQLMLCD